MKAARAAIVVLALPVTLALFHFVARGAARFEAPTVHVPELRVETRGDLRVAGRSSVRRVGKLREVRLAGSPEEIGAAHATLLHDDMVRTEGVVWNLFESRVESRLARTFLLDTGGLAYRRLPDSLTDERRRELAASALAFRPDPFADRFGTFQRFVYLAALYDISLAYEHSPLVGCTTFTFSGKAAEGSPLLARAFDFDVDDVFDEDKVVFLVTEDGKIPFASVAWAGLLGVVSGMNREGLAVVVHGARAGPTRTQGEPVVDELRRLLGESRTTDEAVAALGKTEPLVSHLLILSDAAGHAVSVERVPGAPPFARPLGDAAAVTNHLEGPFRADPKNLRVRETSSTLPRRSRGDALIQGLGHPATVVDAVRLLRDRSDVNGTPLPLGDRRAIDALIATHAVVMETATRRLWVSEAPHSLGRFVAFDLDRLLATDAEPPDPGTYATLPADPLLTSGDYARLPPRPR